jgi:hypothetical protein
MAGKQLIGGVAAVALTAGTYPLVPIAEHAIGGVDYPSIWPTESISIRFGNNDNHPHYRPGKDRLREKFNGYAEEWIKDTAKSSFMASPHTAFLKILTLGEPILPILIETLPTSPRRWLLPLRLIAKDNPVKENATMQEAVDAWLDWWEEYRNSVL